MAMDVLYLVPIMARRKEYHLFLLLNKRRTHTKVSKQKGQEFEGLGPIMKTEEYL